MLKKINKTIMKEEDKELLRIDLCSRIPYHPYVSVILPPGLRGAHWKLEDDLKTRTKLDYYVLKNNDVEYIRPHLRPMSSMSDDERFEWIRESLYEVESRTILGVLEYYYTDYIGEIDKLRPNYKSIDWLNKNNFDYRGLIEKELAIAATKSMYNIFEEETKIPKTLEEAIKALDYELAEEDKKFLLDNGALSVHHSLGQWIRNAWGLWENSELKKFLSEQGFSHPDDMSNFIIEEYITHLKLK